MLCNSDWDSQSGFCADDSPRKGAIAEAQAQQATGVMKGLASAFGLGAALQNATDRDFLSPGDVRQWLEEDGEEGERKKDEKTLRQHGL